MLFALVMVICGFAQWNGCPISLVGKATCETTFLWWHSHHNDINRADHLGREAKQLLITGYKRMTSGTPKLRQSAWRHRGEKEDRWSRWSSAYEGGRKCFGRVRKELLTRDGGNVFGRVRKELQRCVQGSTRKLYPVLQEQMKTKRN